MSINIDMGDYLKEVIASNAPMTKMAIETMRESLSSSKLDKINAKSESIARISALITKMENDGARPSAISAQEDLLEQLKSA